MIGETKAGPSELGDKFDLPIEWGDGSCFPLLFFDPSLISSSLEADLGFFLSDRMGELEPTDLGLLELSGLDDPDFFEEKKSLFLNTILDSKNLITNTMIQLKT